MMLITDQRASQGEAFQTSRLSDRPEEEGPRNPQASYYRARYYNPQLQRFISEDPIGFRGGINKYAYVANAPMDFSDPTGNDAVPVNLCPTIASCPDVPPNPLPGRKPQGQGQVPVPWLPLLGVIPGKLPPGANPLVQALKQQATRPLPQETPPSSLSPDKTPIEPPSGEIPYDKMTPEQKLLYWAAQLAQIDDNLNISIMILINPSPCGGLPSLSSGASGYDGCS